MKKKKVEFMPAQTIVSPARGLGYRPKLRYQKLGSGSIPLFNSLIKPNQVIFAYPEDIPSQYKNIFLCLDPIELQDLAKKENEKFIEKESLYILQEKDIHGWYDVVNTVSGKSLNEKGLRKSDAESLLDSLNS